MLNGNRMKSTRKRHPRDFYMTPFDLADAAIKELRIDGGFSEHYPSFALDAGCGNGVWGKALGRPLFYIAGIDIKPMITTENNRYYDEIITGDFLQLKVATKFDLVFGNPPYSLAEDFVRHAFSLIENKGNVYFLLRLSFLEGIKRCRGFFKEIPLKRVYVCSRRPSFYSSDDTHHTTDTLSYGMFLWQKGYTGRPIIDFLDWEYK